MCRTWNRVLAMEDDRVNKQIFIQDYTSNVLNWCKDFQTVCTSLELDYGRRSVKERRLMCMSKTAAPILSSDVSLLWDPCQKYGSHLVWLALSMASALSMVYP